MDNIINFQLIFFGNFEKLEPTPKLINEFMLIFNDTKFIFLPNIVNVMLVDFKPNPLGVIETPTPQSKSRLQLIDKNQGIDITFLPERLDVTYKTEYGAAKKYKNIEELKEVLETVQDIVLKKLADLDYIKFTRLAVNMFFKSQSMTIEEVEKKRSKLMTQLDFNKCATSASEWQYMINCPEEADMNQKIESLNVLIGIAFNKQNNFENRINNNIDINTSALNNTARFEYSDVRYFNALASAKLYEMYRCLMEL